MSTIPEELAENITGKQLGMVMSIRNAAYHEGKGAGLEICDDCVWIPSPTPEDPKAGNLIPLAVLRAIKVEERIKDDEYNRTHGTSYTERRYTVDTSE